LQLAQADSTNVPAGNSLFSDLSEPSIRVIDEIAQVCRRPKGAIMFFEGDPAVGVYILCGGRANVMTADSEGKTLILKVALPGDVLGLNSVLAGTSHAVTVETVEACRFAFIARQDFLEFLKEHSDACLYFSRRLGQDCQCAYDVVRSMVGPASRRLARFLVSCCGSSRENKRIVRVQLFLTHGAIAQRIGCSRETVSRVLSSFKRRGVAELTGTTLLVHDRAALESLSFS
jgi:CRP/FNR family transcriptional regulator